MAKANTKITRRAAPSSKRGSSNSIETVEELYPIIGRLAAIEHSLFAFLHRVPPNPWFPIGALRSKATGLRKIADALDALAAEKEQET